MAHLKITRAALLAALAVILGWVESLLPLNLGVPGIKLGLGNIAVLAALYLLGTRQAALVAAAKVCLSSLLFSGFSGFVYASCGAALSLAVMCLLYRCRSFSPIGISAAGGICHIAAQFAAAMIATSTPELWRIMPLPLAAGVLTGALTGFAANILIARLGKLFQEK